jgi:aminopeptidase I
MVRNVASMQSLRHNMEGMNFDTPPRRTLYEESTASVRSQPSFTSKVSSPQPQSLSQQHPLLQLCGSDAYTKQLMNRVATGTATEAEQREFAQQVQRGLPAMTNTVVGASSPQEDKAARFKQATRENAEKYTKPFCDFLTDNPTVFHCVDAVKTQLKEAGWKELSERDAWKIEPQGKYFVERNGSALMAFSVGGQYKPGNGAAILAGHVDALTAKLKPVSQVPNKAGYIQLGVAPYAGAPNNTWWDRDLGIGGRVLVKEGNKIVSKLVKLDWPIARIPTLAPHFGAAAQGPFNPETQMVPIIGLEDSETSEEVVEPFSKPSFIGTTGGGASTFVSTQPPRLVRAIANELGIKSNEYGNIVNWELELFDVQPATVGGLDKEFIFAGRVDDKLCSWAAIQALIDAQSTDTVDSSIIKAVGLFDNEEIGSLLRQGARGNFLPSVIERAVTSLNNDISSTSVIGQTYANSFLVSSDVIHAVNPNFLNAYLENHSPRLNVGIVVSADSNGHMTTDSVSTAIMQRCADKVGAKLQVFQIRNDSRSGGTVGPMLSSATGIRAIDCGIPQLSMHSVRATTGNLDPGLGVMAFLGFLNGFESVDKEFR